MSARRHGFCCLIAAAGAAFAAEPPEARKPAREAARAADRENVARFENDPEVLVLPGLVADRREKQVRIRGAFTGLSGSAPAEFFLVPDDGEKDYEALAVSFSAPADIARALEFIGTPPGEPVDHAKLRFWPKGERVRMTFRWGDPEQTARAEEMMLAESTGKPLPLTGFVYVGKAAALGDTALKSVASNYNEPETILDLPRQVSQGEAYGKQTLNPAFTPADGEPVEIVLKPESKDGAPRVADLTLRVTPGKEAPLFTLESGSDVKAGTVREMLSELVRISTEGRDPFVTGSFDPALPLATVRQICVLLAGLEGEQGIRIEPPPPGELFVKAFLPNEKLRDAREAPVSHWRLRLEPSPAGAIGELARLEARDEGPQLGKTAVREARDVGAALERIEEKNPTEHVVVFAPGKLAYGDLLRFLQPFVKSHRIIFIFLSDGAPTED